MKKMLVIMLMLPMVLNCKNFFAALSVKDYNTLKTANPEVYKIGNWYKPTGRSQFSDMWISWIKNADTAPTGYTEVKLGKKYRPGNRYVQPVIQGINIIEESLKLLGGYS